MRVVAVRIALTDSAVFLMDEMLNPIAFCRSLTSGLGLGFGGVEA